MEILRDYKPFHDLDEIKTAAATFNIFLLAHSNCWSYEARLVRLTASPTSVPYTTHLLTNSEPHFTSVTRQPVFQFSLRLLNRICGIVTSMLTPNRTYISYDQRANVATMVRSTLIIRLCL